MLPYAPTVPPSVEGFAKPPTSELIFFSCKFEKLGSPSLFNVMSGVRLHNTPPCNTHFFANWLLVKVLFSGINPSELSFKFTPDDNLMVHCLFKE